MNADLRAILIINVIFLGSISLSVAAIAAWRRPAEKGERLWALGYLGVFVGHLLAGLRGIVPDFLSIVGGNAFAFSGFALVIAGVEVFSGRRLRRIFYSLCVGLALALIVFFTYAVPDTRARIVVYDTVATLMIGAGVAALFSPRTGGPVSRPAERKRLVMIACAEGGMALVLCARTALVGRVDPATWLSEPGVDAMFLVLMTVDCLFLAFLLQRLVADRLQGGLEEALAERDMLMRELNHRAKNDLAMVGSLLSLESSGLSDGVDAKARLALIRSRIHTIGLVYDQLSSMGAGLSVRLDEYLALVARSFADGDGRMRVSAELEPVTIDSKRAIRIGILVNELVMNAFKHAFPEGRRGSIVIGLSRREGRISVVVSDDGVGLPPEAERGRGLGSVLVGALVKQLGAKLVCGADSGTRTEIELAE